MARDNILVGLEIGTSKICAVVGEGRDDSTIRILGVGQTPSRGIRKGEIVDFGTASQCIHDALADAEEKSDVEIKSVWVAVSGGHIQSFNSRGATVIPEDRGEVEEVDLRDVEISAKEVNLPKENTFLHAVIQKYYVDGHDGVLNPLGMLAHRLEANFHIVHGVTTRIQNTIRCIKEVGVDVEDIVLSSLAAAEVVLDANQKNLGALVIDIGGGTTDYIVYADGAIQHSGILAVGGDHVTNDISIGLRLPITRAEKLKIEEGSVEIGIGLPGELITVKNDSGFSGREVEREMLNTIIHARMREIFEHLKKQIDPHVPIDMLGSGVMITGGCALLKGVRTLAEEIFEVPVHVTVPQSVTGPTSAFENPQLTTAIGLLKYGHAMQSITTSTSVLENLGQKFSSLFRGFRL